MEKRKGKETMCCAPINNGLLEMNQVTYDYIRKLTCDVNPILEDPGLKPVVSAVYDNCKE